MPGKRTRAAVEGAPVALASEPGKPERPTPATRGEKPRRAPERPEARKRPAPTGAVLADATMPAPRRLERPRAVEARDKPEPKPGPTAADQEAAGEGRPAKKRRRGKLSLGNVVAGVKALAGAVVTLRGAQPRRRNADAEAALADAVAAGKRVGVVWKRVRCGSPGCHCAAGGQARHGPYAYYQWREGSTVRSVYAGAAGKVASYPTLPTRDVG